MERADQLAVPVSLRCGEWIDPADGPLPKMVAAVQRSDGVIVAVQTTLLTADARKASGQVLPRFTTGPLGDGAVRFGKVTDVMGLAEGVETALSGMEITGIPVWACLGAGRMRRVAVPERVRELHIFRRHDVAGRSAAERMLAAHGHCRRVVQYYPPPQDADWNAALCRERSSTLTSLVREAA